MARSRKERGNGSAKAAPRTGRKPAIDRPAGEPPIAAGSAEALQRENESLRQRVRELERERDTYRDVVYAWAREQFTPDDVRRAVVQEDGLPLNAFIHELERVVSKGGKNDDGKQ